MAGIRDLAQRIKQAVFDATGLTCSIGITPNKLLSKICSELDKPNGLTLLTIDEVPTRIWPCRSSASMASALAAQAQNPGVETIGQLAQ